MSETLLFGNPLPKVEPQLTLEDIISYQRKYNKLLKFVKSLTCCICQEDKCPACLARDLLKDIGEA